MRKILLTLLAGFFVVGLLAQEKEQQKKNGEQPRRYNYKKMSYDPSSEYYNEKLTKPQDKVLDRFEYEYNRLKNPNTGEIPENIRQKELEYVRSEKSGLQVDGPLFRSGVNIDRAPGDQTTSWVNRGPWNVGGRTRALAIDLDDENVLLAGGVSGGMWRSVDQGTSWTRVSGSDDHPTVTDLEQDPTSLNNDTWYYSTGERIGASQGARNFSALLQGDGVYKSTDNGITWSQLSVTDNPTVGLFDSPFDFTFGIEINPTNGDLYVATYLGILRSQDGGTTFDTVLASDPDNFADVHITSAGVMYVAFDNGGGAGGIFRSTTGNDGEWTDITPATFPASFGRTVLHTAPSNENVLYVLASGTPSLPVGNDFWKYTYVSGDGSGAGGIWEDRSANMPDIGGTVGSFNPQGGYNLVVRVHPTDEDLVFIGGTNIYRSFDGFATNDNEAWIGGYSTLNNVSLYTNHHPDQHGMEFFPSNPDKVITAHDGGLSITNDITTDLGLEPVAWTSLNNGYLTTQVYALSIGPGDQLQAGFQDNSTWFTNNTVPTDDWVDVFSGDGSYNAFNDDGTIRYVSAQTGNIWRVTYSDANSAVGLSFTPISPATGLFVAPFELDPNNDERMYYAAGSTIWRNNSLPTATTSSGWTQLTNGAAGNTVSALSVSTSPIDIVYFGTTNGLLYRMDNASTGNPTATDISTGKGLPSANVSSFSIDPNNADDVIVSFSNYGVVSIWQSLNGGDTWTNISGNLEENPDGSGNGPSVRWVTRVGVNDRYFVGTSTGLYTTTILNGASTVWVQENLAGINNAVVEQVRTRNEDGLVVVGTHGNGLYSANYEVTLPPVTINIPIADIEVDANAPDDIKDVSNVFVSNTVPALPITVTVESNSNPSLVSTSIVGNNLTLDYQVDQFGEATISLRGEDSNGDFVISSFNVLVNPPPITVFPYLVDFESDLPAGWEPTGIMPWVISSGGTPSSGTGPTIDHTFGDASGSFIYTEASNLSIDDQGILISRQLDLSSLTSPRLNFWYHMYGSSMGSLAVNIIDLTGMTENEVFSVSGQQQTAGNDPYLPAAVVGIDLSTFAGSVIQLKFIGIRGDDFESDIAIDDIEVFEARNADLSITDISVTNAPFYGVAENVQVEITNFGLVAQSGFDVSYQIDGGTVITEVFAGSIASGASALYTFTATEDLSTISSIDVVASTLLTGDENPGNNSQSAQFTRTTIVDVFPFSEDFESGIAPNSWSTQGIMPWLLNSGPTSSSDTGPLVDHTIGDVSGTYIYTEATGSGAGDEAILLTPGFDLSSSVNPHLNFWYHMFGNDIDQFSVEVIDHTNATETQIFSLSGPQQINQDDPYLIAAPLGLDLSAYVGSLIQVKFTVVRGLDFRGDVALDDISVSELFANDIGITGIEVPEKLVYGANEVVTVTIKNFGSNSQSDFDVSYQLDANTAVIENIAGPIAPGASIEYSFAQTVDLSTPGEYTLSTETLLASDEEVTNNAAELQIRQIEVVGTFPYQESFESGPGAWVASGINSSWELGVPSASRINDASDGTQAWVTNLTGDYNNDENSEVTAFFDMSSLTNPVLLMDIYTASEIDWDGTIVEYSLDSINWQLLGAFGDLDNWYNKGTFNSFSGPGWDDFGQADWVTAIQDLPEVAGQSFVGLRIKFRSDGLFEEEGFAFDNVKIFDLTPPATLDADMVQATQFRAFWDAVSLAEQYSFDLSTDNFTTFVIENSLLTDTEIALTGLTTLQEYQFRVKSIIGSYESNYIENSETPDNPRPVALNATGITLVEFTANWESYPGATEYELFVTTDGFTTNLPGYDGLVVTGTSEVVTGLSPATDYQYRVVAITPSFNSQPSNVINVTTLSNAPLAPTALASDLGVGSINLSWTDNSTDEDEFVIERSIGNDQNFASLATVSADITVFEDTDVTFNTEYYYRVAATNANGTSDFTNAVSSLTLPDSPTAIAATEISSIGFTANWTVNDGADEFSLEVSDDDFSSLLSGFPASLNATSSVVTNLEESTLYKYRVQAINTAGTSAYSEVIEVTTLAIIPNAPTELEANLGDSGISLAWVDNSDNEDEFIVESRLNDEAFSELGRVGADVTTFEHLTANTNSNYTYRIAASNSAGVSDYSNEATFIITSIENGDIDTSIMISPNPTNGLFEVSVMDGKQIEQITVIDAKGRVVDQLNDISDTESTVKLDIRAHLSGIYLVRVTQFDGQVTLKRLVKN